MRIERLKIRHFRSLKSLDLELPQVCALVGPNSSGKSNILKALKLALTQSFVRADSIKDSDCWMGDRSNHVLISVKFSEPIPYSRFKHQTPVPIHGISYEFGQSAKGEPTLTQSCLNAKGDVAQGPMQAPKKGPGAENKFGPIFEIPEAVRDGVPTIYIGTDRSLKDHLPDAKYSMLHRLLKDVEEELQSPECTIELKHPDGHMIEIPRRERFQELMAGAMKTLRTTKLEEIEKTIKQHILHNLGMDTKADVEKLDFHFEPLNAMDFFRTLDLRVKDDSGFPVSATELGDGIQNAIVLAILRTYESMRKQGAIFLIEEPEMFLHPQMQRSLYKTMREMGKDNQVIYTTHSPHFVRIPEYQDVLLVRKDPQRGTQVTVSDLSLDDRGREKLVKELDPERSELFFSERVLFVEGDTEKLALPVYAARKGIDLDRAGASIVEVGGKRNLLEFARISMSFGITTGILFDTDTKEFRDCREDEATLNAELLALQVEGEIHRVWAMSPKYEDVLRKHLGESVYQQRCSKWPNIGKPTQARLLALEEDLSIPSMFGQVVEWLGGRTDANP